MERFFTDPLRNQFNQPVTGTVAVRVQNATPGTGALAPIYSDNGVTLKTNPTTTDAYGQADFYAADGLYDLVFASPTSTQTVIWPSIRIGQKDDISSSQVVVGDLNAATITAALTKAGGTGSIQIPATYAGTETYTSTIQVDDKRGKPNRQRGSINVLTDCGLKGDGVTDDGPAIQACFNAFPGYGFLFPQTVTHGCSYFSGQTLFPRGSGTQISGSSGSQYLDDVTPGHMGGTEICFPTGVSGLWLDIQSPNSSQGGAIRDITLRGAGKITSLITPTGISVPASIPQYNHAITSIQRAGNVLTVVTAPVTSVEGLTQSVGSQVLISGVVGDTTMNGRCIIASITASGGSVDNPLGFTCAQNGANAGPFGAVGTVSPPTTGVSADGIRVCSNFWSIDHVGVVGFERHGLNADSTPGNGCALPFSDDMVISNSMFMENGGDGFFCKGVDCNAGYMSGNSFYYNYLYGVEDQSSIGNTWIGNNISNNGSQWATTAIPATKAISTISRALTSGVSTVTVVLSVADVNLKLGSCVVIAGVTDSSFNSTAGQCFFLTSFTNSTHFQYEQPGAPVNASSSGGTSRLATFAETYLSSGLDSGGIKVATQALNWSTALYSNYLEGGQTCKYGPTVLVMPGATQLACAANNAWKGLWISANGTTPHPSTNITNFINDIDNNMVFTLKTGKTAPFNTTIQYQDYAGVNQWQLFETTNQWEVYDGLGPLKLSFTRAQTRMNSTGANAIELNNSATGGTIGVKFYNGATGPSVVATIDGTGLGTFNGGVIGSSLRSQTANIASAGTVRLAKSDTVLFRNNANGADVSALSLDASDRVVLGGAAGVTSAVFTSATANPAASGAIRLARNDFINFRNNGNSADLQVIGVNAGDDIIFGVNSGATSIQFGQTAGGTTALIPAGNKLGFSETNAPSGAAAQDVCYGDSTAHAIKCSYNNGSFLALPQVISSGTSTLTNAAVNTGVCATVVTTAATGVATTDAISWSYASAPTTPDAKLILNVYPTANNVNFLLCNPTAASLTPTGLVINWRVVR